MTWLGYSARLVPKRLSVSTQPAGATAGQALTTQPVVRVLDGGGELCPAATNSVSAAKHSGVSGTLSGTTSRAAVAGVATFTDLQMSASESNVSIDFAASGLTGVQSANFDVSASGGGAVWEANKPSGATLIGQILFGDQALQGTSFSAIGSTGFLGNQMNLPHWSKAGGAAPTGYWQLAKVPGTYGDVSSGYNWGDFYRSISPSPNNLYICVERMWGSDDGLGYEWHPISNKDQQIDTGVGNYLSQSNEGGSGGEWQAPEILTSDYHPGNNITNPAITSDVKHVCEYIIERAPTNRIRHWRDGVQLCDQSVPSGYLADASGTYFEWYIHHFDGGGGMTRVRTTWIRYYRLSLWRF